MRRLIAPLLLVPALLVPVLPAASATPAPGAPVGAAPAARRWTPVVTATASYALDGVDRSVMRVALRAPSLAGVRLREQSRDLRQGVLSPWAATGRGVTLGARGRAGTVVRGASEGDRLRWVAPAAGARQRAPSPALTFRLTAVPLMLDDADGVTLRDVGDGLVARVALPVAAGQRVGLAVDGVLPEGAGSELSVQAYAPDGTAVPGLDSNRTGGQHRTATFVAPQTGTYRLDVLNLADSTHASLDRMTLWASTPKTYDLTAAQLTLADPPPSYAADRPGQAVVVRYPVVAGGLTMLADAYAGSCAQQRSLPAAPWFEHPVYTGAVVRGVPAVVAGTQVVRVAPCDEVRLDGSRVSVRAPVDETTATVDGGAVLVDAPDALSASLVRFDSVAGDRVDITSCACELHAPDGAVVTGTDNVYDLPLTGGYTLVVLAGNGSARVGLEITRHRGK